MLSIICLSTSNVHAAFKGDGLIKINNLHSGESIEARYRLIDGNYDFKVLDEVSHALRCRMTHKVHDIPSELIEMLDEIQDHFGVESIDVISGYRSPKLNTHLKKHGRGVAKHSLHMDGLAIDIRVPGISSKKVRDYAKSLKKGGVGYYPGSQFIHIDIGRIRYW